MGFDDFVTVVRAEFPEVDDRAIERFRAMEALYGDWNSRINVISRKDMDSLYEHHVLHSLAIASYIRRNGMSGGERRVLDLGTGGGFPGIPLAVMFPEWHFTLCDSIGKKIRVVEGVAEALGLENVRPVNARAEGLGESFDLVVSRAVTSLANFYPWVKGRFTDSILYLRGGDVNEDIAELMGKFKLPKGSVSTWNIDNWLTGDYFKEKFVIQIKKA